ncbi:MAG: response regulator transcription factor [Candidatus Marinimicrobia bacterium]|nr:response regulator transcription factor [Candidatus Neomarinimicrobiota bacterium]
MRILIVEDETSIGEYILGSFKDQGFVCTWFKTGMEALEEILTEEYDCIILDRRLPDMDGLEVCKQVRSQSQQTPIIVLTAMAGVEHTISGLEAGADDYISKPFDIKELIARVQALIRRASLNQSPTIKIRDIELNPMTRTVKLNSDLISFSNREFLLLEFLMRNVGRALTRTQLYEHVWEIADGRDSNIVDVYIRYVRNKIDRNPDLYSHIETIRGFGYRFKADE